MDVADAIGIAVIAVPLAAGVFAQLQNVAANNKRAKLAHVFGVASQLAGNVADALSALPTTVTATAAQSVKARALNQAADALMSHFPTATLASVGITDRNTALSTITGELGKIATGNAASVLPVPAASLPAMQSALGYAEIIARGALAQEAAKIAEEPKVTKEAVISAVENVAPLK